MGKIKTNIESILDTSNGSKVIVIIDSKTHQVTKKRTVSLKVNGQAYVDICITMNAMLPVGGEKKRLTLTSRSTDAHFVATTVSLSGITLDLWGNIVVDAAVTNIGLKHANAKQNAVTIAGTQSRRCALSKVHLQEIAEEIREFDFPIPYLEYHEQILHGANTAACVSESLDDIHSQTPRRPLSLQSSCIETCSNEILEVFGGPLD